MALANFSKHPLPVGLLLIPLLFIQLKLNQSLGLIEVTWTEPPATEGRRLDPELLKILSFGNLPMMIDYLTLVIVGDPSVSKVPKGTHCRSYFYLDAIADLDPMLSEINPLANMIGVLQGDGLGTRNLLEKSQSFVKNHLSEYSEKFKKKYWPHPWQGLIFLAYVNIFELDDLPRGARAFREASVMEGAPLYLQRLEQKLSRPDGEYEVGINLLKFLIDGAKDERYRASLEKKLSNLSIRHFLFKTNLAFKEFMSKLPEKHSGFPSRTLWEKFLKSTHTSLIDPWGGQLYLDNNKILSTTPSQSVFGLE